MMVDFSNSVREEVAAEARRAARIAIIQQQIADGAYETDEKFEAAFEKMLGLYEAGELDCGSIACGEKLPQAPAENRPKKAR